jgi:hypothetical protein
MRKTLNPSAEGDLRPRLVLATRDDLTNLGSERIRQPAANAIWTTMMPGSAIDFTMDEP